jgi:hypothetical protein
VRADSGGDILFQVIGMMMRKNQPTDFQKNTIYRSLLKRVFRPETASFRRHETISGLLHTPFPAPFHPQVEEAMA